MLRFLDWVWDRFDKCSDCRSRCPDCYATNPKWWQHSEPECRGFVQLSRQRENNAQALVPEGLTPN